MRRRAANRRHQTAASPPRMPSRILPSRLPMSKLTPREIVQELDRYIVGQQAAKRAVAIALQSLAAHAARRRCVTR